MAGDIARPPAQNPSFSVQQAPHPITDQHQLQVPMAQAAQVPMAPIANAQNYPAPMAYAQNYTVPMAQPVPNYPGAQASPGGYGVHYAVQPQSFSPQPMPGYGSPHGYGPNGMMPYSGHTETVTVSQPYCGPITCVIGMVLCFFTGFGCVVACCPCDVETRTYVQETRPNY
jgi:hypothetical protein